MTITVIDKGVRAALDALQRRLDNPRPVLQAVAEQMHARVDQRFSTQTGPDGQPWKPNSPATRKRKGGKPVLTDSGDLRASIVGLADAASIMLSAVEPYARIHQFGGTIERAAYSKQVRHRTDSRGELVRSAVMAGRGLVFAKDSDKQAKTRWFEVKAHTVTIPARPYFPVREDGSLYPAEQAAVMDELNEWLAGRDRA